MEFLKQQNSNEMYNNILNYSIQKHDFFSREINDLITPTEFNVKFIEKISLCKYIFNWITLYYKMGNKLSYKSRAKKGFLLILSRPTYFDI